MERALLGCYRSGLVLLRFEIPRGPVPGNTDTPSRPSTFPTDHGILGFDGFSAPPAGAEQDVSTPHLTHAQSGSQPAMLTGKQHHEPGIQIKQGKGENMR